MERKKKGKAAYMISAVAETYSIHPQTLRLYEREGLLKPSRSEGNTRLYTQEDLERLEVILNLTRDLGVNLAGVEVVLNMRQRPEEEQQLGTRVQKGDEDAFRKLIESNLRFVVAMAKKYSRSGYPLHELINEGNMGLIEAASRFDPNRGVRFITYASWWIRQAILAAIAHYGQVFKLPPKLKHELYRFETKVAKLTQELGHRPSVDEISRGLGMTEEVVRHMMEGTPTEVSLSTPVGEQDEAHLEDLIRDPAITPVA